MTAAPPRRETARAGTDGEYAFDARDFQDIAEMLHSDSGIFLAEAKVPLVYGRLAKRLRILGLSSFKDYCRLVAGEHGIDERQRMLSALTTNVTHFFRERHHFDYLKQQVLPPLLARAKDGGRVRIWSAGCSKGHEPLSIAISILSGMPEAAQHDIRILATDIDPIVIAHARQGVYSKEELEEVPPDALRHFKPVPGDKGSNKATDALGRLVTYNELNLMGPWPMKGRFDAIFCRNVAIYFKPETQAALWDRYAGLLQPGGHLFIGHSERLSGPAQTRFTLVGTTTYHLQSESGR